MHKRQLKVSVCIILGSLLLAIIVSFGTSLFREKIIENISNDNAGIYVLTQEDLNQYVNQRYITIASPEIMSQSTYNIMMLKNTHQIDYIIFLCVFIFFTTTSFIIMLLLEKKQQREIKRVMEQLLSIKNESEIFEDDEQHELYNVYAELEKRFKDNLNDYKRLNSYLSHDQKNEIAILKTMTEMNNDREYTPILNKIMASIDDVLTLSESDKSSVTEVDAMLVCAEVIDFYKKIYSDIEFVFSENDNSEILSKERWIYRAIANLIDNAIKYGQNNKVLVSVYAKNNSVLVTVEDNGVGITKEEQKRIFDNHYRINVLQNNGHGIGLSLVKHVCELSDGTVYVESCIGRGTKFILSFPKA